MVYPGTSIPGHGAVRSWLQVLRSGFVARALALQPAKCHPRRIHCRAGNIHLHEKLRVHTFSWNGSCPSECSTTSRMRRLE